MYSITLKPEEDTPQALKRYVQAHKVKPGWTFLTGKPEEINFFRRSLGFKDAKAKLDKDLTNHTGMVKYGNEARQWWAMFPGRRMLLGLLSAFYGWTVGMRKQPVKQSQANPRVMTRDIIIQRCVTKGKKTETRRGTEMNAKHRAGYRLFEILSPLVCAILIPSLGLTQTQSNLTKHSPVEANQTTDFAVGRSPDAILFDGTNIGLQINLAIT